MNYSNRVMGMFVLFWYIKVIEMSDFLTNAKTEFGVSIETIYKETGFFYPYILEVINWYEKKEMVG